MKYRGQTESTHQMSEEGSHYFGLDCDWLWLGHRLLIGMCNNDLNWQWLDYDVSNEYDPVLIVNFALNIALTSMTHFILENIA